MKTKWCGSSICFVCRKLLKKELLNEIESTYVDRYRQDFKNHKTAAKTTLAHCEVKQFYLPRFDIKFALIVRLYKQMFTFSQY